MNIYFFTFSNENNNFYKRFENSCNMNGIIPINVFNNCELKPYYNKFKIKYYYNHLCNKNYDDKDIICFVDSWDLIFLKSKNEIKRRFLEFKKDIIFSCEERFYYQGNINILEKWENKFFLNCGGYIGYKKEIFSMLKEIIDNDYYDLYNCDQSMFYNYDYYNKNKIFLDIESSIFGTYIQDHNMVSRWIFLRFFNYSCRFENKGKNVIEKESKNEICILHQPGKKNFYLNYIAFKNDYRNNLIFEIFINISILFIFFIIFIKLYFIMIPLLVYDKFFNNHKYEIFVRHKIKHYKLKILKNYSIQNMLLYINEYNKKK